MEKEQISYETALLTIESGEAVKCQLGMREDQYTIVHTRVQLQYLYNLSQQGTQMCKMYLVPSKQTSSSENVVEISFDEAYKKVSSGQIVYFKDEEQEEEITGVSQLINLRRVSEARGEKLLLYWHE